MTKGFKSTEFWMTIGGIVLGAYLSMNGVSDMVVMAIIGAGPGYAIGRGVAKHGNGA